MRHHVSPEDFAHVAELPEALTCSGWSLHSTTLEAWSAYFAHLKAQDLPPVSWPSTPGNAIDLFTDGSCYDQHCFASRFAGWSVIFASTHDVHEFAGAEVLDSGVLPGLLQSANRAEIFAIVRALQIAKSFPGLVRLWTDCSSVVRRVRRLLAGQQLRVNSAQADLWNEVVFLLQDRAGPAEITHVSAHQPLHDRRSSRNGALGITCSLTMRPSGSI